MKKILILLLLFSLSLWAKNSSGFELFKPGTYKCEILMKMDDNKAVSLIQTTKVSKVLSGNFYKLSSTFSGEKRPYTFSFSRYDEENNYYTYKGFSANGMMAEEHGRYNYETNTLESKGFFENGTSFISKTSFSQGRTKIIQDLLIYDKHQQLRGKSTIRWTFLED